MMGGGELEKAWEVDAGSGLEKKVWIGGARRVW